MSPEEVRAVLDRHEKAPDPTITAVITLVEDLCDSAVREACGFHTALMLSPARDEAKAKFISAMEKAAQQSEG